MTMLTVEDVAEALKLRRETIRRYIKSGHLQAHRLPGGDFRIDERDVKKLLQGGPRPGGSGR